MQDIFYKIFYFTCIITITSLMYFLAKICLLVTSYSWNIQDIALSFEFN